MAGEEAGEEADVGEARHGGDLSDGVPTAQQKILRAFNAELGAVGDWGHAECREEATAEVGL